MNENKVGAHTQGEWRVENEVEVTSFKKNRPYKSICTADSYFENSKFNKTEAIANAKLIAAAPDMLEALQMIAAIWVRETPTTRVLRNAIKKATE